MPLVVQKYGGSSVADIERIRQVARRVVATRAAGNRVVVVVSAMGGTTDALTKLAHEITPSPQRRELDMLLTAGEREAMALVSLAILSEGLEAVSFTGGQEHVELAPLGARRDFVRQLRQRVGRMAHRRHHDHDPVAGGAGRNHPARDSPDSLDVGDRAPAVLLNYERHREGMKDEG